MKIGQNKVVELTYELEVDGQIVDRCPEERPLDYIHGTRTLLEKFEQASGGTLLLDEISAMPYDLQSKLLRVLQEDYIRRVGGTSDIPVNTRIIATVNEPLYFYNYDNERMLERIKTVIAESRKREAEGKSPLYVCDGFIPESAKSKLKRWRS